MDSFLDTICCEITQYLCPQSVLLVVSSTVRLIAFTKCTTFEQPSGWLTNITIPDIRTDHVQHHVTERVPVSRITVEVLTVLGVKGRRHAVISLHVILHSAPVHFLAMIIGPVQSMQINELLMKLVHCRATGKLPRLVKVAIEVCALPNLARDAILVITSVIFAEPKGIQEIG